MASRCRSTGPRVVSMNFPDLQRMRYEVELVTEEPESRVELLHRNIQKFGTITNTLAKACDLSGTIRAIGDPS